MIDTAETTRTAPDAEIMNAAGRDVRLSDYWRAGTTALIFVRYLACAFCREQLKDIRAHHAELAAAGLRIVVVTPDRPDVVARFAAGFQPPFPVLSDPRRVAYRAYGLTEGSIGQLLNPRVAMRGLTTTLRGNLQGRPTGGSARQLPGSAIVTADGMLLHHHVARDAADHLAARDLLSLALALADG